jgi:hypothetical protein
MKTHLNQDSQSYRTNNVRFRTWCREKWFEYRDECEVYMQQPVLDSNKYFNLYKYWLKREYKHQRQTND